MKIAFYDARQYDRVWFDALCDSYDAEIKYFEVKLNSDTVSLARGFDAVCVFVNDTVDKDVIAGLREYGVKLVLLRCAGYNNVDFKAAFGVINVLRVPAYSPYSIAEHTMGLILAVNRHLPRAYNRTRDFNFNISGLCGFDLHGRTVGVIGTGRIGQVFIGICRGFGLNVIAYDPYPAPDSGIEYVSVDELCARSDIISLHCPLTAETEHIINERTISLMKRGVLIINTSRGALIDSVALLGALRSGHVGGAGLDVYEEEGDLFYEDHSDSIVGDDVLARLLTFPNVLITSHQAFLTADALEAIARTTLQNARDFFDGKPLENEICYSCGKIAVCKKEHKTRCF